MARPISMRLAAGLAGLLSLSACDEGGQGLFSGSGGAETDRAATVAPGETRLIERDVEVPEVFQVTEDGLWDGRPSLGGVWVAYPDVKDPERVIIRNESNGKFVIGALFRRERENPGPALQISSDAAAALDMLAGAPATLNVTALRRQEVPIAGDEGGTLDAAEEIETVALETPSETAEDAGAAVAEAAVAEAETAPGLAREAVAAVAATGAVSAADLAGSDPAPATPPATRVSTLGRPFIQIGLFGVEANANATGQSLRAQGVVPLIEKRTYSGKDYWRVVVGPSSSSSERAALLRKVKALGYNDAYFVGK